MSPCTDLKSFWSAKTSSPSELFLGSGSPVSVTSPAGGAAFRRQEYKNMFSRKTDSLLGIGFPEELFANRDQFSGKTYFILLPSGRTCWRRSRRSSSAGPRTRWSRTSWRRGRRRRQLRLRISCSSFLWRSLHPEERNRIMLAILHSISCKTGYWSEICNLSQ